LVFAYGTVLLEYFGALGFEKGVSHRSLSAKWSVVGKYGLSIMIAYWRIKSPIV